MNFRLHPEEKLNTGFRRALVMFLSVMITFVPLDQTRDRLF